MAEKKIKIAYLSHLDLNLYLFRLAYMQEMVRQGHDVYAVAPGGEFLDKIREAGIKVLSYNVQRPSLNIFSNIFTLIQLFRIFKREKFDIIVTFMHKPNILGTFAGKLAGAPVIVNYITGLGFAYTENKAKAFIARFFINFLYSLSFRISQKVIFLNQDDLLTFSGILEREKALIIKEGVDLNKFSQGKVLEDQTDKLCSDLGIRKGRDIVVTMVSRLSLHKGVVEFVESADILLKKYENLLFLIVGWVDEGNPAAVTSDFIKNISDKRIKFLGQRSDIREILYLTDIFVLPSYREGTPLSILEAMAMEKPVVTTSAPGCREVVRDGINGFVVPLKDSFGLSVAIEKLFLDKPLRLKMGEAGRKIAQSEFSEQEAIMKTCKLIKDLECQFNIGSSSNP